MAKVYHPSQLHLFLVCEECATPFIPKSFRFRKFCSRECFHASRRGKFSSETGTIKASGIRKTCPKCSIEKPIEEFSKDRTQRDGRERRCKKCKQECTRDYRRRTHVPHPRTYGQPDSEGYRTCTICKERKPLAEFVKSETKSGHGARCLPCAQKRWKVYNATYHMDHVGEINDRKRKWRKRNKGKICEYSHRRRARVLEASTDKVNYQQILTRDGYICHICGGTVAPNQLGYDHVIPLTRGGAHSDENIKVAHRVCNSRKSNRLLEEMTPYQRRGVTHTNPPTVS